MVFGLKEKKRWKLSTSPIFGLRMKAPTVTKGEKTRDCQNNVCNEEPLHPLRVVNLPAMITKIIKNPYLQKYYIHVIEWKSQIRIQSVNSL